MPLTPDLITNLGATLSSGPHTRVHSEVRLAIQRTQTYLNQMESTMTANGWVTSARIAPGQIGTSHIAPAGLDASVIKSGALPVARGGTGQTTRTAGWIPYGAGQAPMGMIFPGDLLKRMGVVIIDATVTFSGSEIATLPVNHLDHRLNGGGILYADLLFMDALAHGPFTVHADPVTGPNMTLRIIRTRGGALTAQVPARLFIITAPQPVAT